MVACGGIALSLAGAAMLVKAGIVVLPWSKPPEPSHEGDVLVPLSARVIPAFTRITRDDLIAGGRWVEMWVPKDRVPPGAITDRTKIIGRVMSHEKGPNYSFTEEGDFMPPGTRPGLVAGIPKGKRSLTIEATKIPGLHGLSAGDRFDVLATIKPEKSLVNSGKGPPPQKEPEVRVLVHNGMLISPIRIRATPTTTNSLMNGQRTSTKPVEEVVIAVDPEEIAELSAAFSIDAAITCVARSGHPDDSGESITPGLPPAPPPTTIEAVRGNKTETLYFPVQSDEQQTQFQLPKSPRLWREPSNRLPVAANQRNPGGQHEPR